MFSIKETCEQSELLRLLLGAAVDDGAVQEGGHLVNLLPWAQVTTGSRRRSGSDQ